MAGKTDRAGKRLLHLPFLLGLFVVLAVLYALFFSPPDWLSGFALLFTLSVAPVALAVCIVYGRGFFRTFAIGAVFPASLWFLVAQAIVAGVAACNVDIDEMSIVARLMLLLGVAPALLVYSIYGAAAVVVRLFIERMQRRIEEREDSDVAATVKRPGCRQFTLRGLLAMMTLAGVLCGLLIGAPLPIRLITATFLFVLAPMVLTVCVIYGRGYFRTFAIGALFPASLSIISAYVLVAYAAEFSANDESTLAKLFVLISVAGAFLVFLAYGAIAMGVRWFVERLQPPAESESSDAQASCTQPEDDADPEDPEGPENGAFHVKRDGFES